jgi:glucose/arabinose dehydrogenase
VGRSHTGRRSSDRVRASRSHPHPPNYPNRSSSNSVVKNTSLLALAIGVLLLNGCYALHPSKGGGQAGPVKERQVNAADVALPPGYRIEAVATGLTFPTGATFDDQGRLFVVESGYSYGEVWTTPRLLRIEPNGRTTVVAKGERNGPWTGVAFHDGAFYVAEGGTMEGGRILRIQPDGKVRVLVDQLPSRGDHHVNGPAVSRDGWVYFTVGTASNSGVVGEDNAQFGWLKRHPHFHDIPGADITLVGQNFTTKNALRSGAGERVQTGAFLPFGTPARANQVIKGQTKCSGSVMRVRPDGSDLQLVAWGFRNPFGIAFAPDGECYITENAYDTRGSRPIWGAPDVLWRLQPGLWYGFPDFAGGQPVNTSMFDPPGKPRPEFLLAKHPNQPPQPVATFAVHSSADGLDFSRSERFGHVGQAFVALLGDEAPTVGKTLQPVGFKVVRVDVRSRHVEDFAVNHGRRDGPASKLGSGGLERPVAVRFSPSGEELIVVDFGVMRQDKKGAKPQRGTGVIWRITRDTEAKR